MKNILVITGSPRKHGNTHLLAEAFAKGAQSAGHSVKIFNAAAKEVRGCKACDKCWSQGSACVFKDGFGELAPLLEQADTLVLATPLYWFGFSAQLKAAIDKFYAYMSPACPRPLRIKDAVLLICAGDTQAQVLSGALATYRNILHYMNWADRGIVKALNAQDAGAVMHSKALPKAQALGASL